MYPPAPPVVWLRINPTLVFFSVPVAPATSFPCASEISPRIVDVPVCAQVSAAKNKSVQTKVKKPILVKDKFINCPFHVRTTIEVCDWFTRGGGQAQRLRQISAAQSYAKNGNPPRTTAPPLVLASGEIVFRILLQVCQAMLFRFITAIFQILRTTSFSTYPLLPSPSAPSSLPRDQTPRIPP